MVPPPGTEHIGLRFAPYIQELQEFLSTQELRFGSPRDIFPVADRLASSPSFQADMASMVRSILYREANSITRVDLLQMLVVAIAGPHADDAAEEVHEAVRRLLVFVGGILRNHHNLPAEDAPCSTPDPAPPQDTDSAAAALPPASSLPRAEAEPASPVLDIPAPHPLALEHPRPALSAPSSNARTTPRMSTLRRTAWILGASVVLVGVPVLLLSHHQAASPADQVALTLPSRTPPSQPKPPAGERLNPSANPASGLSAGGSPVLSPRISPASATPSSSPAPQPALPSVTPPAAAALVPQPSTPELESSTARTASATRRFSIPDPSGIGSLTRISSGIMAGHLLSAPPPEYPKLARFTHIQGQVMLQAVVARNGTVVHTHVISGHHLLRGAAEGAVRRWRYRPYLVDGRASDVATIITVDFKLHP